MTDSGRCQTPAGTLRPRRGYAANSRVLHAFFAVAAGASAFGREAAGVLDPAHSGGPHAAAVGDAAVLYRRHRGCEVGRGLVVGVVPGQEIVADAEALQGIVLYVENGFMLSTSLCSPMRKTSGEDEPAEAEASAAGDEYGDGLGDADASAAAGRSSSAVSAAAKTMRCVRTLIM